MKKYFNKIASIAFMLSLLVLGACTDYLDKAPQSDIDPDDAYKNFTNFQGFVEHLYNHIPLITAEDYHNNWNYGEDEYWEPTEQRLAANQFDQGNYWAWETAAYSWFKTGGNPNSFENNDNDPAKNGKGNLWGLSWMAIRKANVGLANLDKLTDASTEERNLIEGQLYFFRGWFHFMLMQYWGGLPYIDEELASNTIFKLPRLSYQETADKAAADFERAATLLPVDWDDTTAGKATLGNNNIRINKVMAYAYLGKNLLWAGSPLMNNVSGGNASYNAEFCKRAADAFVQALKICEDNKRYELADFSEYTQLFYTYNQSGKIPGLKEAIFYENLIKSNGRFRYNQVNDYRPPSLINEGIKCYPTANYVDLYGMANGLPIPDITKPDAESGYNPEYPWVGRDPRFYHDIMVDGEKCVLDASRVGGDLERQYASLYEGGRFRDDPLNRAKSVFTGYMLSKYISKYNNSWEGYRDNCVMVLSLMRLADVYLMYAEATIYGYGGVNSKATGYHLTPIDAVNKIRERAGVGLINNKFTGSTENFMSELRRERAVELAFEGHRFIDLRRWMLLLERPYTLKKAVYFDRGTNDDELYADPLNARVLNLREEILLERKYEEKHYWFPFLRDDVTMYPEFVQNPGW
ncbi:RagB/SusD family nutrient uptake outer membrane protein [Bacteroides sp. 51]|uniref:RagB/SusD family nutrient uptake outer membrane protein n=1 Tax=Bacteroides sp. 51 TaxID=2302938 RepID=UPI0013D155EA|nr:RagB/SusD family nutrient uptake outer membrane protein [Bacteroides sp. 51]NDV81614.1 RagB/SusD family nutrient uptake outer membrane protein [Bacteroides sp. 51]